MALGRNTDRPYIVQGRREACSYAILTISRTAENLTDPTMDLLPLSSHGKPYNAFQEARALEGELRKSIRGEVRLDARSRALYATDASNYRQIPIGLVIPRDADDVVAAVAAARKFGTPVLPRGAGTSWAGQCGNVAVVLDFSKYLNKVLEVDPAERSARVEPRLVLDVLRTQAETHRLSAHTASMRW